MPNEFALLDSLFSYQKHLMQLIANYLPVQSLLSIMSTDKKYNEFFKNDQIWEKRGEDKIGKSLEETEAIGDVYNKYKILFFEQPYPKEKLEKKLLELIYHDDVEPLKKLIEQNKIDTMKSSFLKVPDRDDDKHYLMSPLIFAATVNSVNALRYIFDEFMMTESRANNPPEVDDSITADYETHNDESLSQILVMLFSVASKRCNTKVLKELCKMAESSGETEEKIIHFTYPYAANDVSDELYAAMDNKNYDFLTWLFGKLHKHKLDLEGLLEIQEYEEGDEVEYVRGPCAPFIHAVKNEDLRLTQLIWDTAKMAELPCHKLLEAINNDSTITEEQRELLGRLSETTSSTLPNSDPSQNSLDQPSPIKRASVR